MKTGRYAVFVLGSCLLLCVACAPATAIDGRLRYARLLRLETRAGYELATVIDPWDSTVVRAQYALVPRRTAPDVPPTCTVIEVPCRRVLPQSTVHAALLLRLGAADCLAGICEARFVVSPRLQRELLTDFGSGTTPDVERMKTAGVDAWWYAPFANERPTVVERLGIPTICCADYMESTPLGRAEWMRFYGRLVGRGATADSLFEAEEKAYSTLQRAVQTNRPNRKRPLVMVDRTEHGTWYVPGGQSYVARVIADAGGRYVWADDAHAGSVPMELERMLQRCAEADVWVVKYGEPRELTYDVLASEQPLYTRFRAFRQRRIWGCNTLRRAYYEETPFAPSLLLRAWRNVLEGGAEANGRGEAANDSAGDEPLFTPLR